METKICCRCKEEKLIDDFYWKNKGQNLKQSACAICMRKKNNDEYAKDPIVRDKKRKNGVDGYNRNKEFIQNLKKSLKCSNCGDDRWYVLDFHHIGKKEYNINKMISRNSIDKIKIELEKCIPLCSNCHREEHHFNGYK
jgi:hypothetical protein